MRSIPSWPKPAKALRDRGDHQLSALTGGQEHVWCLADPEQLVRSAPRRLDVGGALVARTVPTWRRRLARLLIRLGVGDDRRDQTHRVDAFGSLLGVRSSQPPDVWALLAEAGTSLIKPVCPGYRLQLQCELGHEPRVVRTRLPARQWPVASSRATAARASKRRSSTSRST